MAVYCVLIAALFRGRVDAAVGAVCGTDERDTRYSAYVRRKREFEEEKGTRTSELAAGSQIDSSQSSLRMRAQEWWLRVRWCVPAATKKVRWSCGGKC